MKKYAIIGTWNGEGYSSENKLHSIIERKSDADAMAFTKELVMLEMVVNTDEDDDEFFTRENGNGWITGNEEDSGSYQFFEIKDDTFGFVILTNINEVTMVNEEEFYEIKEFAIGQADLNEYEDGELDSDDVFIGAHEGAYDHQFITMKN